MTSNTLPTLSFKLNADRIYIPDIKAGIPLLSNIVAMMRILEAIVGDEYIATPESDPQTCAARHDLLQGMEWAEDPKKSLGIIAHYMAELYLKAVAARQPTEQIYDNGHGYVNMVEVESFIHHRPYARVNIDGMYKSFADNECDYQTSTFISLELKPIDLLVSFCLNEELGQLRYKEWGFIPEHRDTARQMQRVVDFLYKAQIVSKAQKEEWGQDAQRCFKGLWRLVSKEADYIEQHRLYYEAVLVGTALEEENVTAIEGLPAVYAQAKANYSGEKELSLLLRIH